MELKKIIYDIKILKYFFRSRDKFFKRLTKYHSKNSFFSYHIRPKKVASLVDDSIKIEEKLEKVGIVIQGPLQIEDNFTYETLKYYKKIYKNCEIILSTWEDENEKELKKIEKLDINILKNKKPNSIGYRNLNFQIVSTYNGIKLAKEKGCKYILKTRTDIRIYEAGVDKFLISLLNIFPSKNNLQNKRVIGIDINTTKNLITLSDIFQFGTTEELEKIWDIPLDERAKDVIKIEENLKNYGIYKEVKEFLFPEKYILKKYLEKIGVKFETNLAFYYKMLKDSFIIIDASMIDMYWNKYNRDEYKERKEYGREILNSYITFSDWITIYNNLPISLDNIIENKKYSILTKYTNEDLENVKEGR